jgi:hypothetical protein
LENSPEETLLVVESPTSVLEQNIDCAMSTTDSATSEPEDSRFGVSGPNEVRNRVEIENESVSSSEEQFIREVLLDLEFGEMDLESINGDNRNIDLLDDDHDDDGGNGGSDDDEEDQCDEEAEGPVDGDKFRERPECVASGPLSEYIQEVVERVKSEYKNSSLPQCYRNGSLWVHPPEIPFVKLKRNAPFHPSELYKQPIFVWLPDLLVVGDLMCPSCGKNKLAGDGWPSVPVARRVVDLHNCFWVMTKRYRCIPCKTGYYGTNPLLLKSLPKHLQEQFPARYSHRSAISKAVLNLMRTCFHGSLGPDPFADLLRENHSRTRDRLELQYLSYHHHLRNAVAPPPGANIPKYAPFSSFGDRTGYAGFTPSASYLRSIYIDYVNEHRDEMNQHMAMLDADILKGDASYKVRCHMLLEFFCTNSQYRSRNTLEKLTG